MSNQEILEKAIQKAIYGGWEPLVKYKVTDEFGAWASIVPEKGKDWQSKIIYYQPKEVIIFNHDFAKALWGEEYQPMGYPFDHLTLTDADYHLMMMVISPDPISYLGNNLDA